MISSTCTRFFNAEKAPELIAAEALHLSSSITKMEGQTLGLLTELIDKPVRLKREIVKIFAGTPSDIYDDAHLLVRQLIESFVPPATKKAKLG